MLYFQSLIQTIGLANFILRAVVVVCALFLVFSIFAGLAFLFGFHV